MKKTAKDIALEVLQTARDEYGTTDSEVLEALVDAYVSEGTLPRGQVDRVWREIHAIW